MVDKKKPKTVTVEDANKLKAALAAAAAKMATLPQLDSLTQLPNKALFEDRLAQAMARARRSQKMMAVVFMDIHHTKLLLAKLGANGKTLLTKEFVQRFLTTIRESDTLARIGFDRYAVIMEEVKSVKQVRKIIEKIIDQVDSGFLIEGDDVTITASIGVSFYDGADDTLQDLMAFAEKALFKAKAGDQSAYEIAGTLASTDN